MGRNIPTGGVASSTQLPASPTIGDMIQWNGTAWAALAAGADGEVLTSTGAAALLNYEAASGGVTVTSDTAAAIEALGSPTAGDVGFPTDDGALMLVYNGAAWVRKYAGVTVTKPASTGNGWINQGTSTVAAVAGNVVLTPQTADIRGRYFNEPSSGDYTAVMGIVAAAPRSVGFGLYEVATQKSVILYFHNDGSVGDSLYVVAHTADMTAFSAWKVGPTPIDTAPYVPGGVLWGRVRRVSTTVYWDIGAGPDGPWTEIFSEAQTASFTTAPDAYFFAVDPDSDTTGASLVHLAAA